MRNNPSVFFGRQATAEERCPYEGHGLTSRPCGTRRRRDSAALGDRGHGRRRGAHTPNDSAPWWPTDRETSSGYFRATQTRYRDQGPIIEEKDFRDEAMRGIWDDYTPPHLGGFKPGPLDTYHWQWNLSCGRLHGSGKLPESMPG